MAPKKQRKNQREFKVGDLVGAKCGKWPIWPAEVTGVNPENKRKQYAVVYFYTKDTSLLSANALKPFEEMTQSELEKKCVQKAVAECRQKLAERSKGSRSKSSLEHNDDLSGINNDDIKNTNGTEEKILNDQSKSDHSLSRSTIDHNSRVSLDGDENVMHNPTIEKLKKKIAIKMQEKEALKIIRLQKKDYERASKKFPRVYEKLDQLLSITEKSLNDRICNKNTITKLEDAHKRLEKTLLICIDKLTTDYGKRQKDCIRFQDKLTRIIRNLKKVREKQGVKNPELVKVAKRVLKAYKIKAIRDFVNDSNIAENLNDVMNDRKENDAIKMEIKME